jgi:hypothetical protein
MYAWINPLIFEVLALVLSNILGADLYLFVTPFLESYFRPVIYSFLNRLNNCFMSRVAVSLVNLTYSSLLEPWGFHRGLLLPLVWWNWMG